FPTSSIALAMGSGWTSWTFFAYWISNLITPGGWATSSSFVEMGLTWWESCLAMYVGGFLLE
ncbi:hypothetical protein, partial [Serratia marcescens]|uniref:hypothetical protein n=1 Tax=Serratia marcescens TaxID=615 RepID=UPI0019532B8A